MHGLYSKALLNSIRTVDSVELLHIGDPCRLFCVSKPVLFNLFTVF